MNKNEMFSIRQMIELTGISEFTLRGWENRYAAFKPYRSETGRREYSKDDVERAMLLRELLKRGHKISKIAKLKNKDLLALFEKTDQEDEIHEGLDTNPIVSNIIELMALQKWSELSLYIKKIPVHKKSALIGDFFLPVLTELAHQIAAGHVSIAQEHILSSFLKEKIYSVLNYLDANTKLKTSSKKIRFVLATPEGDHHEIGLLMAHLMVRAAGFTSLYLGPHTPAQDLSETALRYEASHILIVSTVSKKYGARQDLLAYVNDIQKKIGPQTKILMAGGQTPVLSMEKESSLMSLSNFIEFESYLKPLGGKS